MAGALRGGMDGWVIGDARYITRPENRLCLIKTQDYANDLLTRIMFLSHD
jgi:hypothetical protein